MPNYRRLRIPGGTYFFTVALEDRRSDLLVRRIHHLRSAWAATLLEAPFRGDTVVVLPDHLHAIWTLPPGDADFSDRWRRIKGRFAQALPPDARRSPSKRSKGEKGVWQRRFWEHAIRDEADLERCRKYCWFNPVKHGVARRPVDWPHSSIHRDIRRGLAEPEWAGAIEAFGETVGWVKPTISNPSR